MTAPTPRRDDLTAAAVRAIGTRLAGMVDGAVDEVAEWIAPVVARITADRERAAYAEGADHARAAVAALHQRREQAVFDEVDCAEGDCDHEPGTCVVVSPAVCAHCADQTAPDEPWEHAIREAAYWPCATIRVLADLPAAPETPEVGHG